MVFTGEISLKTRGRGDIINITGEVQGIISKSGLKNGIVNVFLPGSTGAITTIEYEPGLKKDINDLMDKLAPYGVPYAHHNTWHDDNGSSHLLSALFKPSFCVPLVNGKLTLGTWQQIVFCECDTRPRRRTLIVQVVGE